MAKTGSERSFAASSRLLFLVGQVLLCLILAGAATSQSRGVLHLRSDSGTEVFWEGVRLGTIGSDGRLSIRNVPPGKFSLRFSKAEHEPLAVSVVVAEGEEKTVAVLLERYSAGEALPSVNVSLPSPVAALPSAPLDLTSVIEVGGRGPSPFLWFVLILLLSLLAAAAVLWRRGYWEGLLLSRWGGPGEAGSKEPREPGEGASWEPREEASWELRGAKNVGTREDPQDLLSKIRRHEQDLAETRSGEARIIDAEFVELADDEGTSA